MSATVFPPQGSIDPTRDYLEDVESKFQENWPLVRPKAEPPSGPSNKTSSSLSRTSHLPSRDCSPTASGECAVQSEGFRYTTPLGSQGNSLGSTIIYSHRSDEADESGVIHRSTATVTSPEAEGGKGKMKALRMEPGISPALSRFPSPLDTVISIRRGPRITHFPSSTDRPVGQAKIRSQAIRREKYILALVGTAALAVVSFTAATTYLCVKISIIGEWDGGVVAWLVVSLVLCIGSSFGLFYGTIKNLPKDPEWLELGQHGKFQRNPEQDSTAIQDRFWHKFAQYQQQLRRYVEALEDKLRHAEEKLAKENGGTDSGRRTKAGVAKEPKQPPAIPSRTDNCVYGQPSGQQLLQPAMHDMATIPFSATQGSILTQLCAAVSEPYSPLAKDRGMSSPLGNTPHAVESCESQRRGRLPSIDIVCGKVHEV